MMDQKENLILPANNFQELDKQTELDGLETVVKNVLPILNSPILALLAVPVNHLKQEEKKKVKKETEVRKYLSNDDELFSEEKEESDERTKCKLGKGKESYKSTKTSEINECKRGNISEHSDLATIAENKEEQDCLVKHENLSAKFSEEEYNEEIESVSEMNEDNDHKKQGGNLEVENNSIKNGIKTLQKCNVM